MTKHTAKRRLDGLIQFLLADGRSNTIARRTFTISIYAALTCLLLALMPLLVPFAALFDWIKHRDPSRRWPTLRTLGFLVTYFLCEWAGIVIAWFLWLIRPAIGSSAFVAANFRLQCWWGGTLFKAGALLFGFRAQGSGEAALESGGPMLLFIRHSSMADTVLALHFISLPYQIMLRYVLKRPLLFDPCLDIVGNRLPNHFSRHATSRRQYELDAIAGLAEDLGPREGVLIYPEGTRFSQTKRRQQNTKLAARAPGSREHQLGEQMQHVLLPRRGGPMALLERNLQLAEPADLVFCSHTGFEGSASFDTLTNGALIDQTIYVHFWRVPADQIPRDPEKHFLWFAEQWSKVDDFIAATAEGDRSA